MQSFDLPKDFLLGAATSSLQIEGGDQNNSWYQWSEQGHITDGSNCSVTCDHWMRIDQDIGLMENINLHSYRMSLEWSRIEPQEGCFNQQAIHHYRQEIEKLLNAGIKPLVTLHHFSNPLWLEKNNGWLNQKVILLFERYTEYVVRQLADLVEDWITINEPNVYLYNGFMAGLWPPGKNNQAKSYFKGAKNMILAHIKAYKKIHEIGLNCNKKFKVGVAHHLRLFDPIKKSLLAGLSSKIHYHLFQNLFLIGMTHGRFTFPLGNKYPLGKGCYSDFLGINYYTREMLKGVFNPFSFFGKRQINQNTQVNDLGWEIYPEGLFRLLEKIAAQFKLPIYITENGICDKHDQLRSQFIYDHLFQINKAINQGIDVRAYYHWSLMDNFEWKEGLSACFGLYLVDFKTQARKLRKSGQFYAEICKNNSVSQDLLKRFL